MKGPFWVACALTLGVFSLSACGGGPSGSNGGGGGTGGVGGTTSSGGGGGTGGVGGTTSSGGGGGTGGVASSARGAWFVAFRQTSAECVVANHNQGLGQVTADQKTKLLENSEELVPGDPSSAVDVACAVSAAGQAFQVNASANGAGSFLSFSVPSLAPTATKDNPSTGVVLYQSPQTADSYSQADCLFYFLPGTPQSVTAGQVFLAFECGQIASSAMSVCSLDESYAAFEGCAAN